MFASYPYWKTNLIREYQIIFKNPPRKPTSARDLHSFVQTWAPARDDGRSRRDRSPRRSAPRVSDLIDSGGVPRARLRTSISPDTDWGLVLDCREAVPPGRER